MRAGGPDVLAALRDRTGMRRVLLAYAVFDVLEFYTWVVVVLWAFAIGGASLAALAAVVQLLPAAVAAPLLAGVGDRLPRGTALALSHAAVAASVLAVAVALGTSAALPVVLVAAAAVTTSISVVRPVHFATLPPLSSGPASLVSATSLSSILDGTARFLGPLAAGVAVAAIGPAAAFALAVPVAVLPPLLCLRLGLRAPLRQEDVGSPLREASAGLRSLWGDWAALGLLLVLAVDFVLTGALDVMGTALAVDALGIGDRGAGLVIGAVGLGGFLGAGAASALVHGRRVGRLAVGGVLVEGAAFAGVALCGGLLPVLVLVALMGLGGAVTLVAGRTLLQRATDDRLMARVFAVQESTALLGLALGALLAPLLIGAFGPSRAFLPLGLAVLVGGVVCVLPIRRLQARARYLPEEIGLLRGVPFLSVLPEYDLERLARSSRWAEVPAGTPVVRQGDEGRDFFVVGEGEVSVTVDGVRRPGSLPRGRHFGEIALLRSIRRTASVTAETDTRLLVLRREHFLAAVTGNPDGMSVADEVAAGYEDLNR